MCFATGVLCTLVLYIMTMTFTMQNQSFYSLHVLEWEQLRSSKGDVNVKTYPQIGQGDIA